MMRHMIVQYAPVAIAIILGLYILIKLLLINLLGLREDPFMLFLNSFQLYSRQVVKNTFHKTLQRYYKLSNKINVLFYLLGGGMLFLYLFVTFIG